MQINQSIMVSCQSTVVDSSSTSSCRLCILTMRSGSFVPVDHSSQPRIVKHCRPPVFYLLLDQSASSNPASLFLQRSLPNTSNLPTDDHLRRVVDLCWLGVTLVRFISCDFPTIKLFYYLA